MTDKALEMATRRVTGICECGHVRGDHRADTRGTWRRNSPLGPCRKYQSPCRYYQRRCDCKEFRPVRFAVTRVDPDERTPQQKLDTLKESVERFGRVVKK